MKCVITGDIINSRSVVDQSVWLIPFKKALVQYVNDVRWDIYRGDSFQIEIGKPELGLEIAFLVKALVKMNQQLDVRLGIGIGKREFVADRVAESNGEAYYNSGSIFDQIVGSKASMAIKTPDLELNKEINLYLRLLQPFTDSWSAKVAEVAFEIFQNRDSTQMEIASRLKITQSSVSDRLKRSHVDNFLLVNDRYIERIKSIL